MVDRAQAASLAAELKSELEQHIIGQSAVIDELLICLASGGHALLEGVPGLAKTLLVSTLAASTHLRFNRIQFTPDLMPSDIIGTEVIRENKDSGERSLVFLPGPVFASIILADEINRTPPKTQAALLEAMQERRVSTGGETRPLPSPFFVLATQNPLEQEGTYLLPEAQLDRFLVKIVIDYPSEEDELRVILSTTDNDEVPNRGVVDGEQLLAIQKLVRDTPITEEVARYAIDLVRASRPGSGSVLSELVRWGAGPRAGQALLLCAKARATLHGSAQVAFSDIAAVAKPVLRHRLQPNYEAEAQGLDADGLVDRLLADIPHTRSKTADHPAVSRLLA
jgi:MoxR-like ATPase